MKQAAEARAATTETRVAKLGAEIEAFRNEAKAEMQRENDRIQQETARQIAKVEEQAHLEIEFGGQGRKRELKTYAASLALELAEQRIRGRMDALTEAGLIDGLVSDLKQQESRN